MSFDLSRFWTELEVNFPLGGTRRRLRELLGEELAAELERVGLLIHRRVATRYPCVHFAAPSCPRVVHHRTDRSIVALCGNAIAECPPLELTAADIDVLAVNPERLGQLVGRALRLRVNVEAVRGIADAYRFGMFVPEPGIEHTVYFLAHCTGRNYSVAVDALRTHAAGRSIAILLPTDRFMSESFRRRTAVVPLIALADVVEPDEQGGLRARVDPLQLFASAGVGADVASAVSHVATAYVREAGRVPVWRRLDQAGYQRLRARSSAFDIFADELARTVVKAPGAEQFEDVPAGQFRWIRAALESPRHFDPGTGDDDGVAAKQLFQRARRLFDVKTEDGWSLFQTRLVGNHATYRFDPRPGVSFAFVFTPRPGDLGARTTVDDDLTPIEIARSRRGDRHPGA